jgi:hypothetical protein
MHLLRPLRHSVVVARTSAVRSARTPVTFLRPNFVRGLLTQSRDRGPSDVSMIERTKQGDDEVSKRMIYDPQL